MNRYFYLSALLTCYLYSSPIQIDLTNPSLQSGVLQTSSGGIIQGENFRIQAKCIRYTHNDEEHLQTIEASDDLMVEYGHRIFLGSQFFYDFEAKKGFLIDGKTSDGLWYIGGARLDFLPDQSVVAKDIFATTSEDREQVWGFHGKHLTLTKEKDLKVNSITFKTCQTPILYLPYYSTNLKKKTDSPIRYSADWESGQGPKVSMRYRVYETDVFALFTRLDYRLARGGGGALETDYTSLDKRSTFKTKSYLAHDTFSADPKPEVYKTRYRLQGISSLKRNSKMDVFMRYDYISDKFMPSDFPSDDFELGTAKRTELIINRVDPYVTSNFYLRPRINSFQGFKQELPTFRLGIKPLNLFGSGIMLDNSFHIAYLDYEYSRQMQIPKNQPPLPQFAAGRLETNQSLYRPLDCKLFLLTPQVQYKGIYYTNNPSNEATGFSIYTLRLGGKTTLYKNFPSFDHMVTPYGEYTYSDTTNFLSNHFIFSIEDGFSRLHQLKAGIKNAFYLKNSLQTSCMIDLFAFDFYDTIPASYKTPLIECNISLLGSRMSLEGMVRWDCNSNHLLQTNGIWKWTISNDLAFSAELRHRSAYQLRKSQENNFYVNVTRSEEELLNSPLSDKRNTLLLKAQANLTPFTFCRLQSHIGWGRVNQPAYTESKLDIYTMITTNWRLRMTYQHTVYDDQISFGISLIPYKKT